MKQKTLAQVIKTAEEFDALAVNIDEFATRHELMERLLPDLRDGPVGYLKSQMEGSLAEYDPAIVGDKTRVPIFGTYAGALWDGDVELDGRKSELRGWLFLPSGIRSGFGSHADGGGIFSFQCDYDQSRDNIDHKSVERILACKEYLFKGFKEQELCSGVTLLLPTSKSAPELMAELKSRIWSPYQNRCY